MVVFIVRTNLKIGKTKSFGRGKDARKKYNLRKGTIFYQAKLKKTKFLKILELWIQKASLQLIAYVLRIDRDSVSHVIKKISNIVVERYYNISEKIGGNNRIVEIDESKFGKRKHHRGHKVEGVWVL
ncbi:hypothetical protein NGRA_2994 [Nosema granulosis]|uniref:Transposase n=1 Tax=Nosema granulosis TaxID=83296 RepID=A0A9P6KXX2_9MICR|nr:hypothetical protein NGRA_2994 [Nosema granulosis]